MEDPPLLRDHREYGHFQWLGGYLLRVTSARFNATTPLQFSAEMWPPAMSVYTELIRTAAISSLRRFPMDSIALNAR